ncbi:MAG: monovalent cation/H(+) antiporter subunit G [Chloroflexi bacterium]|nr:monovalent cation/H(+) antiporter subunit G [Chloroflexota bacterium]
MTVLAIILISAGVLFLVVSCIGIIRLPDFYTRIHAVGKSETLGAMLILGGLAIHNGLAISSLKIIVVLVFVLIANPTAAHLLGRAALRSRLELWTRRGEEEALEREAIETGKEAAERDNGLAA